MTGFWYHNRLKALRDLQREVTAQLQDLIDLVDRVRERDLVPLHAEEVRLLAALLEVDRG